jgi:hypothetical protein
MAKAAACEAALRAAGYQEAAIVGAVLPRSEALTPIEILSAAAAEPLAGRAPSLG